MCPVKVTSSQANLKAKSPSKLIQQGVDNAWGAQKGTENPKQALAQKFNDNPVKVTGGESKK